MGLPWLDVSVEPFRHGGRLGLPWSDVSADPFRHGGRLGLTWLNVSVVDVFVTLEYIHLYILCIVPRCLFQEVFVM